MKAKTRTIVCMAVLIGLMLVFGFTPIGYIPLPFAELTLMCLPVIVGTLVLGLRAGIGLSLVFIATSLMQLVMKPTAFALILLEANPVLCVVALIVPRLLIAPVTAWVERLMQGRFPRMSMVAASAAGSFINTLVTLLLWQWWFAPAIAEGYGLTMAGATGIIWMIALTNGLPEAAIAAVVCPPISRAIAKSVPKLTKAVRKEGT